ncbi:MAG: TonB-dependent hemoglobin/transferrin/lactoferrin family receptor [Magnetospirillum sp. WYHS-4]
MRSLAGAAILALTMAAGPALADEAKVAIDVPPQNLATALEALATQSHAQLLYSSNLVRGVSGSEVKGTVTATEALKKLLQGTGLEAKATGEGSFTIVKAVVAPVTRMDTVTVTATRTENRAFDVPASVTTVSRDQIDDAQARSIATVMQQIPGVTMAGTPRQGGQLPTIRGYQGPDIVLRVDDARRSLDASVGILSPLYVDPNFVKQVDVVRGPSSATYGGGGLGGVMAFQTIEAEDILTPGQSMGGKVKGGYRTGDSSYSGNLGAAARSEGASILASATGTKYSNIETGVDEMPYEWNWQNGWRKNGLMKFGFDADDNNNIRISYMHVSDEGYGPTNPASNVRAQTGYQNQNRSQDDLVASWKFKDSEGSLLDGKVTTYFTKLKLDNDKRTTGASDNTRDVSTGGINAQNSSRFSTFSLGHRLTYGADTYRDTLSNTNAGVANTVEPYGHLVALGGFIQDEIQVARDWTAIATLRHDGYEAEGGGYPVTSNSRLSPKLALKWQAMKELGFFGSYSEAFRAPVLTELYQDIQGTGYFSNFRPNSTLRPQTNATWELGLTLAFDGLLKANDAFRLKISGFDESSSDFITSKTVGTYARTAPYAGTGSIFQYVNVPNAHRWGGEAELNYRIDDWDLGLGYSRLRVKNQDTGENLFAPPDKVTGSLGYYIDDYWSVRYGGRYVFAQEYDGTIARRRSGYAVHDIGTSYDRDWYRIDFGITNLFDKGYATYHQSLDTSYVYEEGRSFNFTLTARF